MTDFDSAHPSLAAALDVRGYTSATPVQQAVLEASAGADLLVSAKTGSGKTVAFGLAMAANLLGEALRFEPAGSPLALVIAPTRELALQVQRELAWLYAPAEGRVLACVGGMDPRRESRALMEGAHVVVGTPGRLVDHMDRGNLDLASIKVLVLDEADEMLDMGFREELEQLLGGTPAERRTLLFSATLPDPILAMASRYQRAPQRVAVDGAEEGHPDLRYEALLVAAREREHAVVNLLRQADPQAALVFCNTREDTARLAASLCERGFLAVLLSGELSQNERNRALSALRDGRARIGVCTDVAARGLDLPAVDMVIHFDLPHDPAVLQHRSGRTGRAGRKGRAIVLATPARQRVARSLMQQAGIQPQWLELPKAEGIRQLDQERLHRRLREQLEPGEGAEAPDAEELAEARALVAVISAEALALAVLRAERGHMPAPEEMPLSESIHRPEPRRPEPPRRPEGRSRADARPPWEPPRRRPNDGPPGPPPGYPSGPPDEDWGPPPGEFGARWFRMSLGRNGRADPKWIVPMLCRRGNIHRDAIGEIRVLAFETRFAIHPAAADAFFDLARHPDPRDPRVRIFPCPPPRD